MAGSANDEAHLFAKTFFHTAWEIAKEKGMTQKEFAVAIFGYEKAFYTTRRDETNMSLAHAFKAAKLVGWKFSRLIELVRIKLEE